MSRLFPPAIRPWAAPVETALSRWIVPCDLLKNYTEAQESGAGALFAKRLLDSMNIGFEVDPRDLERIPASGAAVLVANHPHGIVEGLILTVLLNSIRQDFRIAANSILSGISAMSGHTVLLNPFETSTAVAQNRRPLRRCLEWLVSGGLLAMFPAGEVAHWNLGERTVTDPPWKTTAARLALRTQCRVVPVFFEGANSLPFQMAGMLHPGLRTIGLPREFRKMRHKTVRVRIGNGITHNTLKQYCDPSKATEYLRSRTYFLSLRSAPSPRQSKPEVLRTQPVAGGAPAADRLVANEVAALGPSRELISNGEFAVYLAEANEIPALLVEIGRCREIAFREVGEGTGRETDLDRFDLYYRHLFLWHKADVRLAGAYRLAFTQDMLPRFGTAGLYTSTLFRYKPRFFERLGPAVELGRSFVRPEYQKGYAPLLLLWKAISRVVERRPEAAVLFGAVSTSRDYRSESRGLIATYLSRRVSHELAHLVQPRSVYRDQAAQKACVRRLAELALDIEDISLSISDIEGNGRGVPVLIRQYLKAGGQLLGFNVDAGFSGVLDALIAADLRTASPAILERCMGRTAANAFLEWHALHGSRQAG